jgi:phage gp37-like protein
MRYAEIEEAIITRLRPLKEDGLVREILPYSGELTPERLEETALRFPAIFVYVAGMQNEVRNLVDRREWEIVVFVGALSLRGKNAAAAYEVIEAVRERLHRQVLFEGASPLFVISEQVFGVSSQGTALIRAVYRFKSC